MGGSAVAGDVVADWLSQHGSVPIEVIKDYHLPNNVTPRSLVVAISCSGDTEETVSVLLEAVKRRVPCVAVSSGGMLEQVSLKHHVLHIKVKMLSSPRSSLPFILVAAARIVLNALGDNEKEIELTRCGEVIREVGKQVSTETSTELNPAIELAKKIRNAETIIYTPTVLQAAATRFKNSLNENSKTHSAVEVLPELCHNEIEAWRSGVNDWIPILLRWSKEPPEVKNRFEALKSVMRNKGTEPLEVLAKGNDHLSRLISLIYLLDFSTLYLAKLKGINPLPTPNIDQLKKKLASKLSYLGKHVPK